MALKLNAALELRGVTISLQRHELEERARVTMQEEREALRQFYRETAEGCLAREAREAAEAAAAMEAEEEGARQARMSMEAAAMAAARTTANDAEAGPSNAQGPHGGGVE